MFTRLLQTTYFLAGNWKRLWYDYCSIAGMMNIPNKTFLVLMIGAALLAVFGPLASANTMQLTLDYGSRHSGDGGEFNASSSDFAPATMGYAPSTTFNGGFETFCVEYNEHFTPGSTYYYGISQGAINGGVSGGNPDPISRGTAWLYLQFATGNLTGYDYSTGAGGNASAAALQAAIWFLEGEGGAGNQFSPLVATQLGSDYLLDNNGYYGVGVLNLWADSNHTQFAQDQLMLVPDGGSTVMLLGLGLLGLIVGRWKLNRRSHAA